MAYLLDRTENKKLFKAKLHKHRKYKTYFLYFNIVLNITLWLKILLHHC